MLFTSGPSISVLCKKESGGLEEKKQDQGKLKILCMLRISSWVHSSPKYLSSPAVTKNTHNSFALAQEEKGHTSPRRQEDTYDIVFKMTWESKQT